MIPSDKPDLKSFLKDELVAFFAEMGEPSFRAHQVMQWLFNKKARSFDEMTNLSKPLREKLEALTTFTHLETVSTLQAADGTRKYLFALPDSRRIESVFIPEEKRNTLCISSQAGCALKCGFCATGTMGYQRNLTAGEIVDQIVAVARDIGDDARITNIVMMGMGEPFLNYDNVVKSLRIMIEESALQKGGRKITVSTAGIVPKIYDFAKESLNIKLAVSLNATTNDIRNKLMPINRKYPIEEVIKATKYFFGKSGNRVTFEYILIEGVTDTLADADRLIELTSSFPCKVNLIPLNPAENSPYRSPSDSRIEAFYQRMLKHPFAVTLRKSRGRDICGACGQLKAALSNNCQFDAEGPGQVSRA